MLRIEAHNTGLAAAIRRRVVAEFTELSRHVVLIAISRTPFA